MLTLVIKSEKCLTVNLSKEPNFVLTFLLKILRQSMHTNFKKKTALLLYSHDFRTRLQSLNSCIIFPQSQLQCDMLLLHSFDIIDLKTRRVGYGDSQLRISCGIVTL